LFGLFFYPEEEGDIFLCNACCFSKGLLDILSLKTEPFLLPLSSFSFYIPFVPTWSIKHP
jgi:hypothetical protein